MIDKSKIQITLAEGLVQEGDIEVSGRTATFKVKANQTGADKAIKVKYNNKSEVSETVTVVEKVVMTNFTSDKQSGAETDDIVTFTATFNKAPELGSFSITGLESDTVQQEASLSGSTITAKYKLTAADGERTITAKYKDDSKQLKLNVTAPTINNLTANPTTVEEGGLITVTMNFNELA